CLFVNFITDSSLQSFPAAKGAASRRIDVARSSASKRSCEGTRTNRRRPLCLLSLPKQGACRSCRTGGPRSSRCTRKRGRSDDACSFVSQRHTEWIGERKLQASSDRQRFR